MTNEPKFTPEQFSYDELDEIATELYESLKTARECIAYCRRNHPDVQKGEGFPIELFIDATLAKARGEV